MIENIFVNKKLQKIPFFKKMKKIDFGISKFMSLIFNYSKLLDLSNIFEIYIHKPSI